MTISRWKLMAGFLGLSVGGLAMCCAQTSPVLPTPPKIDLPEPGPLNLPVPPAAGNKASPDKEIEIVLPVLNPPKPLELVPVKAEEKGKAEEKKPAPTPSVNEIPSLGGIYEPPAAPKSEPKEGLGELEKIVPKAPTPVTGLDLNPVSPPATKKAPAPKPTELTPEPTKVATPPAPAFDPAPTRFEEPKAPAKLVVTEAPVAKPVAKPEVKPEAAGTKLKLLLRMGTGTPRFEIRSTTSEELLFKVYGEKIEMQAAPDGGKGSPLAGVTAVGKVKFIGPGVEGTCDSLTLLSGTGEVLMKGNVQLKTKTGRTWSELAAEKMMYQIGLNGLKVTPNPITPTSYRE